MEWTIKWWQVSVQRIYPNPAQLSQTYDKAASWWHPYLRVLGYRHAYRSLWKKLQTRNILPLWKENAAICDCGIGTAAFSLALTQTISPKVHITGVDLSSEMLNTAHRQLTGANVHHQMFLDNVTRLPFADGTFDGVISAHMLEHLSDPADGLREMVRVLRPGAPVVLTVTRPGRLGWLIQWGWGNRYFSQQQLSALMQEAEFINLQFVQFPFSLARFTSLTCVGFRRS